MFYLTWGYKKGNFEVAMKVGKPAMRQLNTAGKKHVVSECPLAGIHLEQGIEQLAGDAPKPERVGHGLCDDLGRNEDADADDVGDDDGSGIDGAQAPLEVLRPGRML